MRFSSEHVSACVFMTDPVDLRRPIPFLAVSRVVSQAERYRLFAVGPPLTTPTKPGMIRTNAGSCIKVPMELYDVPLAMVGAFVSKVGLPFVVQLLRGLLSGPAQPLTSPASLCCLSKTQAMIWHHRCRLLWLLGPLSLKTASSARDLYAKAS